MELHDFAAEQEIRERNAVLVPRLLKKLKELQVVGEEQRQQEREELFKRPFALFSKSPNKRRISKDSDELSAAAAPTAPAAPVIPEPTTPAAEPATGAVLPTTNGISELPNNHEPKE